MKRLISIFASCLAMLLVTMNSNAQAVASKQGTPPSDASINELLAVTNVRAMIDNMWPQVQMAMRNGIQQASKGQQLTPEQQARAEKMQAEVLAAYKDEFTWEKFQPMYVRIYKASFTQEEVNGMLAFYRTPVGQSTVKKMPLVMQNTMLEVQGMMAPVMERLQKAAREAQANAKAAGGKSQSSPAEKKN